MEYLKTVKAMMVLIRYTSNECQHCLPANICSSISTNKGPAPCHPCPTPDFLTSCNQSSSNEVRAGLIQAAHGQPAVISLGSSLRSFRERTMHILSSHLPWTGLRASWPGCQGSWPRFHPALHSCQTHLQGENPTPHRVSPKSFLGRGLQDGLRLGFLPFGAGKSLR